jgi:RNA polymerase sigma factor (sigma-70 family)
MPRRRDQTQGKGDAELLEACLAGDERAWDLLVERYSRLVFSIALKSGLDEHDAADVVQDVFTIVLRRLESLQQADRFSAWLITTTHRESWRFSKSRRTVPDALPEETVDPEPAVDSLVVEWEHATLTHQALAQLGDQCRRLLDLLFLRDEQTRYEAIAAELGISVGSIGPVRARCLKRLKDHLAEVGVVDPFH